MSKLLSFCKVFIFASMLSVVGTNLSAYEIKHGYSADNGMTYYGVCENGKDLVVLETTDGKFVYEGPASKGVIKKDGSLDVAARKACGE